MTNARVYLFRVLLGEIRDGLQERIDQRAAQRMTHVELPLVITVGANSHVKVPHAGFELPREVESLGDRPSRDDALHRLAEDLRAWEREREREREGMWEPIENSSAPGTYFDF